MQKFGIRQKIKIWCFWQCQYCHIYRQQWDGGVQFYSNTFFALLKSLFSGRAAFHPFSFAWQRVRHSMCWQISRVQERLTTWAPYWYIFNVRVVKYGGIQIHCSSVQINWSGKFCVMIINICDTQNIFLVMSDIFEFSLNVGWIPATGFFCFFFK